MHFLDIPKFDIDDCISVNVDHIETYDNHLLKEGGRVLLITMTSGREIYSSWTAEDFSVALNRFEPGEK